MSRHFTEDELALYYYGELRTPRRVEIHLESCAACRNTYRDIAGTLAMMTAPAVPERADQYGLEVWQRIRYKLPEAGEGGRHVISRFSRFSGFSAFSRFSRFWDFSRTPSGAGLVAAAAVLVIGAFIAGRIWDRTDSLSTIVDRT